MRHQSTFTNHQSFVPQHSRCSTKRLDNLRAAAASPPDTGRQQILDLLKLPRNSTARREALNAAVAQLCPGTPQANGAGSSLKLGDGLWEVFSAPHIEKMSSILGTEFHPIQYRLDGQKIVSNVMYSNPLFKEGWLSASGTISASSSSTLQIDFDRFWLDIGNTSLRQDDPGSEASKPWDKLVNMVGKLGFISQFSYFPVLYIEQDIAVFSFPPLRSNIAIQRI